MKRTYIAELFLFAIAPWSLQTFAQDKLPRRVADERSRILLVNPFVGTAGHGHTFPGATVPFGMVQLSPDTRTEGWDACGGYHYSDSALLGFSHTHLSGTGVADYGDILILPAMDQFGVQPTELFSHASESASPGYYSVALQRSGIKAELTAAKRVGVHRYTFSHSGQADIFIDLIHGLGPDRVLESSMEVEGDREVVGFRRSDGWAHDQKIFFVARFSKSFNGFVLNHADSLQDDPRRAAGHSLRACVQIEVLRNESITVAVGLSSVSVEGARKNLQFEVPRLDFELVRRNAESAWEKELNKIRISGGTVQQQRTFYTALYHSMIAPNVFSDVDGQYRGMDGKIHTAEGFEMYTVFSLWDTFRALHPLLTLLDPKRTLDFVQSLLEKFAEAGMLPVWELASNETWCMIGYHSIPVIVDAHAKGVRGFDAAHALRAMTATADRDPFGLKYYRTYGCIPSELEGESVSKTLEYAYDDWAIARFAQALKHDAEFGRFAERSQYWKNVFDASTGTMRGKQNGAWVEPYDPASVNINYTEANAWQYSFFVPHAIDELMEFHGGRERFEQRLDTLFFGSPEMTGRVQSDITGTIGQYAQGNEPSHHVAYLYDFAGAPWKTQSLVRRVMDSLYTDAPDGLCGNDDCGQMSAWYVFSALGFYPVTPGSPEYIVGSPLFPQAAFDLGNGKPFTIRADGNSARSKYIQSATLNGKPIRRLFLTHKELTDGGTLVFTMGETASAFGSSPNALPHQQRFAPVAAVPVFLPSTKSFVDSLAVTIQSSQSGASVFYSTSADSSAGVRKYTVPVVLKKSARLSAYVEIPGHIRSRPVSAEYISAKPIGHVWLNTRYAPHYSGGGDEGLVDGVRGGVDFRLGGWQGYEGVDCDAVIDLGKSTPLSGASLGCLQDQNAWIFAPAQVEYSFSLDGENFSNLTIVKTNIQPTEPNPVIVEFSTPLDVVARFVRVRAKSLGVCPAWHKGSGGKCWVFVDEVQVKRKN